MSRTPFLPLMAFLLMPAMAFAQGTVTGTVTDDVGAVMPGANVVVVGTDLGTATDADGNYSIENVPVGTQQIRAMFVGYDRSTQTVTIQDGAVVTVNFQLSPDVFGLGEVVVTGALTERARGRAEVAVGRIDAADLVDRVRYQDLSQLISGKVPGVNVQTASGNIGGGVRFNLRAGASFADAQPLIIIDGVRVDNNAYVGVGVGGQNLSALASLNPNDIESIDILKGPAASALYGTDAAAGVVLITSRRGQLGAPGAANLMINYAGTVGSNSQSVAYTEATGGLNFDLANQMFRTGPVQEHVIGASGGSEFVRFFGQYSHRNEEGHLPNNWGERRTMRANFDAFPRPNLTLSASGSYSMNTLSRPHNDNNVQGFLGNTILGPAPWGFTDSLAVLALQNITRNGQYTGSFEARFDPIPGLSLRARAGVDMSDIRQDDQRPPGFSYPGIGTQGDMVIWTRENDQVTFDIDGRYRYEPIENLRMTTAVGVQGYDRRVRTFWVQMQEFVSPLLVHSGAAAEFVGSNETMQNLRQMGVLFDQSVDYDDTFLFGFGARYDVASAIGPQAPNIIYPFARAAVLLNQFDFIPEPITLFKPRMAYGESGLMPSIFDPIFLLYGTLSGGHGVGAVPTAAGNPEIVPERVREFEVGLDINVGSLIEFETTFFLQNATDAIIPRPNPPSSGRPGTTPINVGSITGQGMELGLSVSPIRTQDVALDLSTNLTWTRNEVQDIGEEDEIFSIWEYLVVQPGLPRHSFYVPEVLGALFNDDGVMVGVDVGDRIALKTPYPTTSGSFSANLTLFQDVSLYAMMEYHLGMQVLNMTDQFRMNFGNHPEWTEMNERLGDLTPGTQEYEDLANQIAFMHPDYDFNHIHDADFLRLRELSLRVDLGRYVAMAPGLSGVRTAALQLSGRNLWLSTRYPGIDPEVNTAGSTEGTAVPRQGLDFLTLQQPRTFLVTLSLGI